MNTEDVSRTEGKCMLKNINKIPLSPHQEHPAILGIEISLNQYNSLTDFYVLIPGT